MSGTGSILDAVRNLITPEFIDKVSSQLGESPGNVTRGLTTAIPAVLGGLAIAGSNETGAQNLTGMIQRSGFADTAASDLVGQVIRGFSTGSMGDTAQSFINTIFGDKVSSVTQTVAESSGLRSGSARSLLAMAVPFIMKVIGDQAGGRLDAKWLMSFLSEQKSHIASAMPGLSTLLSGITGAAAGVAGAATNNVARIGRAVRKSEPDKPSTAAWFVPVAAAILLALGGAWLYQRSEGNKTQLEDLSGILPSLPGSSEPDITLPSTNPPNGNDVLATFLQNVNPDELPKAIAFTNINFEFGSANLVPESIAHVHKLAETLNAHPGVTVRIEGHTDGIGDVASNKQLSLARANAVRNELAERGVESTRIDVAGIGDERPIASNNTEEGRAQNRRIEVVVLSVSPEAVAH